MEYEEHPLSSSRGSGNKVSILITMYGWMEYSSQYFSENGMMIL